ncbi:MAG: hypothetical protein Q7U75_04050 [Desulfobacterales bacterium]|nr:hypothetical protein [Desulfobacterales bacterium]
MRKKTRRVPGKRESKKACRGPEPELRISPCTFPDDAVARLVDDLIVPALLRAWEQSRQLRAAAVADNDERGGVAA